MTRPNYFNDRPSRWKRMGRWVAARGAVIGFSLAGLAVVALGWYWQATLRCTAVAVENTTFAEADEVRELAAVDSGQVLYAIDPAVIRDRVSRHPWVRDASVGRLPTGTLSIEVREREPGALVLGADERPAYYVDYGGYRMPLVRGHMFDVPLIRGMGIPYEPVGAVEDSTVRAFLRALGEHRDAERLISEIIVEGDRIRLRTIASPRGHSIPVRVGGGEFADKLTRLAAFWKQAVRRYDLTYEQIDLRFSDQVVVRESS